MLIPVSAMSQSGSILTDTVYSTNIFETNFYNDLNSANFNSLLNYENNIERFGFLITNNFLSNVSKLNKNFFRDFNSLNLLMSYDVKEDIDVGVGFQNKFYTDDKTVETNENNSNYFYANMDASMMNSVFFNTKLGYKTEDQIGEFNSGFSGFFETQTNNYNLNDYITNGNLILFYEDLDQKQNHNYEINTEIYKRFAQQVDNTGRLTFYNQKNDFFFPASPGVALLYDVLNNIESRDENYFYIGDMLNYGFTDDIILSLGGNYMNRIIKREYKYKPTSNNVFFENTYDNQITENNLEVYTNLNYNWRNLFTQLRVLISERSENHTLINPEGLTAAQISELERAEKNKNNNSRRTSLLFNAYYPLSNTNSFNFTGSTSLLLYDTDFQDNFDDRDESESIVSASYNFNNLNNFYVETRFEYIVSKLSYIYSQRSANNYTNRVYKLGSYSSFKPVERFTTNNFFQVLANYTVYEFEDLISQVQSFSYRQLSIRDSSSYNLGRGFKLNFAAELKFYEQGEFLNNSFSVKPITFYAEQFYMPGINFMINNFLNFGVGYKYYIQDRYNYDEAEKVLANTYKSYGPVGIAEMYMNNNSLIKFILGLDQIEYLNPSQTNSSVNFQLNILWNM